MSTPIPSYAVRILVTESGERLPLLIDTATGSPNLDITVFTVSGPRSKNLATASIEQILRAVMVFLLFCKKFEIDLKERMVEGKLLDLSEIESLNAFCRLQLKEIHNQGIYEQGKN